MKVVGYCDRKGNLRVKDLKQGDVFSLLNERGAENPTVYLMGRDRETCLSLIIGSVKKCHPNEEVVLYPFAEVSLGPGTTLKTGREGVICPLAE